MMIGTRGAARTATALLALAVLADGFCYRKNPPKSQESAELLLQPGNYSIWVCVRSADVVADLERAPKTNITEIWISMSRAERLRSEAFARFADKLAKIGIWASGVREIEDGALKGLKELKGLELPSNELTSVRAAWFKDTPKLLELNLANNNIQSLEFDFLKHVPALVDLDLRGNELTALPGDFAERLPQGLRRLNLNGNPLNYKQTREAVEWSRGREDGGPASELRLKQLKYVFNVTAGCLEGKPSAEASPEAVDKCAEERMAKELLLLLAASGNATDAHRA